MRDGKRPAVLYSSAQHAREWITPEMNRRLLHYYLDNYRHQSARSRKIIDTTELWFVPVANPDGYDFTFTDGNRLWRKNLRDNDGDGVITGNDGVDPNRNYPTKWGYDNEGSSPRPAARPTAAPRPLRAGDPGAGWLMRRIGFEFLVNYHSAAELLLYGVGWQVATPTPDDQIYEALAGDDAQPAIPGYDPDIAAELYTTNGETDRARRRSPTARSVHPGDVDLRDGQRGRPERCLGPGRLRERLQLPGLRGARAGRVREEHPVRARGGEVRAGPVASRSRVGQIGPGFRGRQLRRVLRRSAAGGRHRPPGHQGPDAAVLDLRRRERQARVHEWRGGERYGAGYDVYYGEFRGTISGTKPG